MLPTRGNPLAWAILVLIPLLLCSLSSASSPSSSSSTRNNNETVTSEAAAVADSFASCFNDSKSSSISNDVSAGAQEYSATVIQGSHKFSINLLKFLSNFESKDTSSGLLISPFSVWSALISTFMGSAGDTEDEIRQVLDVQGIPKHAVGMSYQGLRLWYKLKKAATTAATEKGLNKKYLYASANKIFVNDKMQLRECIAEHFADELQPIDFGDARQAAKEINDWVSELTYGKIKQLVSGGGLSPWTQVVIVNGVYFQSQWLYKFDALATRNMTFQVNPTEAMEVPFMQQTGNFMFGVSETLKATAIDLPYANQQFSMLIVLPETSRGVDGLIKLIRPQDIYEILGNMYDDEIEVSLPKFKLEQEFDLAGPLYSMGVKKLFDPRFADLTGFFKPSNSSNSQKGVPINSVIHKASITVNEEGTEAAAATAFLMARSGRPAFPTRFIADRPFLFFLRDTATNVILFVGAVRRPTY